MCAKCHNDLYTVYFSESEDKTIRVNVLAKDFKTPSIERLEGVFKVSICTMGFLSKEEIDNFISSIQLANATIQEIEFLLKEFKF